MTHRRSKSFPATGLAPALLVASLIVAGAAKAEQDPAPAANAVRNAVISMAVADAAIPLAAAVELARPAETAADLVTTAALKPDVADAMAAVRPVVVRRQVAATDVNLIDRRPHRLYREPFALILGIGY